MFQQKLVGATTSGLPKYLIDAGVNGLVGMSITSPFLSSVFANTKVVSNPVLQFYFGSGGSGPTLTLGGDLPNPDLNYKTYYIVPKIVCKFFMQPTLKNLTIYF